MNNKERIIESEEWRMGSYWVCEGLEFEHKPQI